MATITTKIIDTIEPRRGWHIHAHKVADGDCTTSTCTAGTPTSDNLRFVGVPGEHELAMLATAAEGSAAAEQRYRDRLRDQTNLNGLFIPLAEALWWVCVADEGYEEIGGQRYRHDRDNDQDGQVVAGVRFARNRTTHQRALMLRRTGGFTLPFTLPLSIPPTEFVWRPRQELPRGRRDRRGEAAYEHHLDGRPARETLMRCSAWLARASARPARWAEEASG